MKLKDRRIPSAKSIQRKRNTSEIPESAGSNADDGYVPERFSTDLDSINESKSQNYADDHNVSNSVLSPNHSNAAVENGLLSASIGDFERKNFNRQKFLPRLKNSRR
jgi:hypothetical protein